MPLSPIKYPNLVGQGYEEKSATSPRYNCIAWAAEDSANWWWPDPAYHWPANAPHEDTVAAFVTMFEGLGYEACENWALEEGYKKVAIYALNGRAKHAARQLPNGTWTSKMGSDVDIEHATPQGLEGPYYGTVVAIMRKRI